jgi:hypothetical protein
MLSGTEHMPWSGGSAISFTALPAESSALRCAKHSTQEAKESTVHRRKAIGSTSGTLATIPALVLLLSDHPLHMQHATSHVRHDAYCML